MNEKEKDARDAALHEAEQICEKYAQKWTRDSHVARFLRYARDDIRRLREGGSQ